MPQQRGGGETDAHRLSSSVGPETTGPVCPLCMETLEPMDRDFYPCPCDYQVCLWCVVHIREKLGGKCPACRQLYDESKYRFSRPKGEQKPSRNRVNEKKVVASRAGPSPANQKRQNSVAKNQKACSAPPAVVTTATGNQHRLRNVRVIQRHLVYVLGIPASIAQNEDLKSLNYFGRYGTITNFVLCKNQTANAVAGTGPSSSSSQPSYSAYVTYASEQEAIDCIQDIDGSCFENRNLRASFGTTKYCSYFFRGLKCIKPDCFYLHELGPEEDSFTKEEMMAARNASCLIPASANNESCSLMAGPRKEEVRETASSDKKKLSSNASASQRRSASTTLYRLQLQRRLTESKLLPAKEDNPPAPAKHRMRKNGKVTKSAHALGPLQHDASSEAVHTNVTTLFGSGVPPELFSMLKSQVQSTSSVKAKNALGQSGSADTNDTPCARKQTVMQPNHQKERGPALAQSTAPDAGSTAKSGRGCPNAQAQSKTPGATTPPVPDASSGKQDHQENQKSNVWRQGRNSVIRTVLGQKELEALTGNNLNSVASVKCDSLEPQTEKLSPSDDTSSDAALLRSTLNSDAVSSNVNVAPHIIESSTEKVTPAATIKPTCETTMPVNPVAFRAFPLNDYARQCIALGADALPGNPVPLNLGAFRDAARFSDFYNAYNDPDTVPAYAQFEQQHLPWDSPPRLRKLSTETDDVATDQRSRHNKIGKAVPNRIPWLELANQARPIERGRFAPRYRKKRFPNGRGGRPVVHPDHSAINYKPCFAFVNDNDAFEVLNFRRHPNDNRDTGVGYSFLANLRTPDLFLDVAKSTDASTNTHPARENREPTTTHVPSNPWPTETPTPDMCQPQGAVTPSHAQLPKPVSFSSKSQSASKNFCPPDVIAERTRPQERGNASQTTLKDHTLTVDFLRSILPNANITLTSQNGSQFCYTPQPTTSSVPSLPSSSTSHRSFASFKTTSAEARDVTFNAPDPCPKVSQPTNSVSGRNEFLSDDPSASSVYASHRARIL